jgi:DNA-directed RNA polymerase specialized sigma24 family protein
VTTESQPAADWTVLTPDVMAKARLVANSVASSTNAQSLMDGDDLYQEALLLCATNASVIRDYITQGELGHLYTWLRGRVTNTVRTEVARSSKSISFEAAVKAWGE